MKKTLHFSSGIVNGSDMRELIKVLPEMEVLFRQRKSFDEYYFEEAEVELTIEHVSKLSEEFTIEIVGSMIYLQN